MPDFDEEVLKCFLKNQLQLFPEKVAETLEEAEVHTQVIGKQ